MSETAEPAPGGSLRGGVAWSVGAVVVSKALSLVSLLVLAGLLAPDQFGLVAAVAAYIALLELGSDLGMKPAIVYEAEQGITRRVQVAYTLNILLSLALCLVAVLAAPLVAALFGVPGEADLFRLGALNIALTGLGNVHDAILLRDLSFGRRVRPQFARDLARVGVSVGLAAAGMGAEALVIGFLAGTATWVAVHWIMTPLRPKPVLDLRIARSMAAYGGAAALLEVLAVIAGRIDVIAIGAFLDPEALGVYTIAYRLPEVLLASVAYAMGVVAFPALSRKRAGDRAALAGATMTLLRYQSLYALPVAALVALCATPIVELLFSHHWNYAGRVMVPICLGFAMLTAIFPLGDLLKATGKQRSMVLITAVEIPLLIVACAITAPHGILGVAWAMSGILVLVALAQTVCVCRELELGPRAPLEAMAPAIAAATGAILAGGAVRLLTDGDGVLVLLAVGGAGALGAVLGLRVGAPAMFAEVRGQIAGVVGSRVLRRGAAPAAT